MTQAFRLDFVRSPFRAHLPIARDCALPALGLEPGGQG